MANTSAPMRRRVPLAPVEGRPLDDVAHGSALPEPGVVAAPALVDGRGLAPLRRAARPAAAPPWGPLRRLITIGGGPAVKALPEAPKALKGQRVWPKVSALAKVWLRDGEPHDYTTPEKLYEALVAEVEAEGAGRGQQGGGRAATRPEGKKKEKKSTAKATWPTIYFAVTVPGKVTPIDWNDFETEAAKELCAELLKAPVQVSSNPKTTACHGNTHEKLPKAVVVPKGGDLADLPKEEQPDHTPYIEFLIEGHKTASGIERGIIDRESGELYLTAHYNTGSFVQLVHAPANLVGNWKAKAEVYCSELKDG